MPIRYSTNWMGPASMDWYKQRGFTKKVEVVLTEDSVLVKLGQAQAGDPWEYYEITETYSAGRIDISGLDEKEYYCGMSEMSLPPMKSEDWSRFSDWLDTVETDDVWKLEYLVRFYEKENPKITWAETPEWDRYDE